MNTFNDRNTIIAVCIGLLAVLGILYAPNIIMLVLFVTIAWDRSGLSQRR